MNAASREEYWPEVKAVVVAMYPHLADWRVRMVAVERGLTLWSGSRGELASLFDSAASEDLVLNPTSEWVDQFEKEQTDSLDPLPGHHLIVMESKDGQHRQIVNVLSAAMVVGNPNAVPENRLSLADANREIMGESYTILPSGTAIVCELTMLNGHKEHGIANVVDIKNFSFEEGKKAARGKALDGVFRVLAHRKHETVKNG